MNPMQNSSTSKATSKLPRKRKGKRKRVLEATDDQVAETPSVFSFAIAKVAVAQICQSVGYKRSEVDALEILTDVSARYLQAIARSAASFANASNRTNSNLFDLINGIHDMCSVQGFPGGSAMHKSNLLGSKALKEIKNFVTLSNEVPFAKPIPLKNISGGQNPKLTIDSGTSICHFKKAKIQDLHMPSWLPDFPKESLYNSCDQVLVKERKCGEKSWEHSLAVEDCGGDVEKSTCVLQTNDSGTSICHFKKAKIRDSHIPRWLPDFPKESLYNSRDQVLVKERKCGEKLWELSLAVEGCSGNVEENICVLQTNGINGKEEKDIRMELAKVRGRVKFKLGREEEKHIELGVNMMNGVCKGGKRVSWKTDSMVEDNEDERWAFKREVA